MGPFRQSDAVLTIAQDNKRRAIEVTAANDAAGSITGYPLEELRGKAFQEIVTPKVAEAITDYVEFYAGANDVGDVLRKIRDFQIQNRDGKAISFKLRIVRHNSVEHDEYLLIMHNEEAQRETDAFLSALLAKIGTSKNADSGLPDRASFLSGVELATQEQQKIDKGVSFAMVELDNYEQILSKHGIQACHQVVQDVAKLCVQNLRGNDVVAHVSGNRLGLLLIGAAKEPAQMVLNRLRWLIAGQSSNVDGAKVQTTATILFHELAPEDEAEKLLVHAEDTLKDKPSDSVNLVAYI
ncbi:MAG: diguanylate cyclase [Alphaproteobacteria bacterium]|nr:diguanylate cyclase [Alphaproteobacteria bacterium]